jgi:quinol monooxygenase YgiN
MNTLLQLLNQPLLLVATIALLVAGCSAQTDKKTTGSKNNDTEFSPDNMAIKAIIELQANPGKRDELKAFIDNLVATHGPGGPGFIRSTRYEVLDNPDRLIEIAEWESVEAREAHMKAAAATGIYAPLKDLLAEPFKVTIIKQLR